MKPIVPALVVSLFLLLPASAQEGGKLGADRERLTDLFGRGLADRASKWRCTITSQYVCSKKGCDQNPPTVWINLDFSANLYERCDAKGCDAYPMRSFVGGIYTTISLARPGTFLKAVNDGSEFVEVASMGNVTFNTFGRCTPR